MLSSILSNRPLEAVALTAPGDDVGDGDGDAFIYLQCRSRKPVG